MRGRDDGYRRWTTRGRPQTDSGGAQILEPFLSIRGVTNRIGMNLASS